MAIFVDYDNFYVNIIMLTKTTRDIRFFTIFNSGDNILGCTRDSATKYSFASFLAEQAYRVRNIYPIGRLHNYRRGIL